MLTIPNLPTQDKYVDALTLGPVPTTRQIKYVVANRAVLMRVWPKLKSGTIPAQTDELLVTPEANVITDAIGVQFKSALPGVPAQVIAQLLEPGDPTFGSGTPFSATISGSGGITPGVSSVQVQRNGALVSQEPILDLLDGIVSGAAGGMLWGLADDPANTRALLQLLGVPIVDVVAGNALPAAPVEGMTIGYFPNSAFDPEAVWIMRYRAATARWWWCGGTPLAQADSGGSFRQNSLAATWQATTSLAAVTVPRGGRYRCIFGAGVFLVTTPSDDLRLGTSANGATPVRPWLVRTLAAAENPGGQSSFPGGELTVDIALTAGQAAILQMFSGAPANVALIGATFGVRPVYFT